MKIQAEGKGGPSSPLTVQWGSLAYTGLAGLDYEYIYLATHTILDSQSSFYLHLVSHCFSHVDSLPKTWRMVSPLGPICLKAHHQRKIPPMAIVPARAEPSCIIFMVRFYPPIPSLLGDPAAAGREGQLSVISHTCEARRHFL